jgi:Cellulase (glycosyl hydrolase family 5)
VIVSRRDALRGGLALLFLHGSAGARAATPPTTRFRRGINVWPWFSLTKEYPAPRTDYPWPPFQEQRPIPTKTDLRRLRAAGFDFIRIPVDPGPFLSFSQEKRTMLLSSLTEAVEEAVSADLSVIVNIQPNESTHYWVAERMIGSRTAPAFDLYSALVVEIAEALERLKVERLAFEPFNEPPQTCDSSMWNAVQTTLLTRARSAAPKLTLLATGACGSMISGLQHLEPSPLLILQPILFTFHFYEPYLFSHQGALWMHEPMYRWLNDVPWPASAGTLEQSLASVRHKMAEDTSYSTRDKAAVFKEIQRVLTEYFAAQPARPFIDHHLDLVQNWATSNRIPPDQILMGEFGALRSDSRYTAAKPADRVRYIHDVREAVEAKGFSWAFWNLFDSMGLMDDLTRTLDPDLIGALGLMMPTIETDRAGDGTYSKRSRRILPAR